MYLVIMAHIVAYPIKYIHALSYFNRTQPNSS